MTFTLKALQTVTISGRTYRQGETLKLGDRAVLTLWDTIFFTRRKIFEIVTIEDDPAKEGENRSIIGRAA